MLYTFVTVFFIAVLSDTLQVRGLLQVYLRQYFSSERNLFRFLQSKDKFGSHTFCTDHINGYVLKPGETFSFNGVVGERTAAKGYKEGGVYVGGETVQQLGGGVCQVASVLYYCTLKSDLEVIARQEHQYVPDYIPWGMDATIYWGSLDYKFRNNTTYPIRILAEASGGYVRVRFMGTETKDYTVELDYKAAMTHKSKT